MAMMDFLDDSNVYELTELFKSLGDPTRVRILYALNEEERNVTDLANHLAISQSALSHQLRVLRAQRLVTYRREGKHSFYRLATSKVLEVMRAGLEQVEGGGHVAS